MVNNVTYMKSWLARGAKNTLLDHYKKKNPELLHNEALIESLLVDNYTPETNVTVADELEYLLAKLQQRIEQLSWPKSITDMIIRKLASCWIYQFLR